MEVGVKPDCVRRSKGPFKTVALVDRDNEHDHDRDLHEASEKLQYLKSLLLVLLRPQEILLFYQIDCARSLLNNTERHCTPIE